MEEGEEIYDEIIKYLSNLFDLSFGLVENLLGTTFVVFLFFALRSLLRKLAMTKLTPEYRDETISEVIPASLRLISFGFLAKIWLTGEASLESSFHISKPLMGHIVETIYVILFYMGARFASEVFFGIKFSGNEAKQYTSRKTTTILLGCICFVLILKIWFKQSTNLSTYFGLLSAGLAIALQDVISSIAAWVYIYTVKPFKIGDRIQIGDKSGDVSDIRLLQFSLLETGQWVKGDQSTGRIIYYPNSFVFKNSISNYEAGFEHIFAEMPITVTFESDWKKAQKILEAIVTLETRGYKEAAYRQIRKASREMRLKFAYLDSRVIVSVVDIGVCLTLRFLCTVRERRLLESKIWQDVLKAFAKESSIDFAYPTTRYYYNLKEGKPGTIPKG